MKIYRSVVCWGNNCCAEVGGLPDGSFIAIDVGQRHSVALRSSGYLWAQGGLFWPYGYDEGDEPGGVISSPVIERYSYDVFGKPTIKAPDGSTRTTSAYGNRYMFTGREYDKEAGLYYYRARYYSPTLGRFLQTDPIGYEGGLNLYTYVGNNPIMRIDPLGLWYGKYHSELTRLAMRRAGFDQADIDWASVSNFYEDRDNFFDNASHFMPGYESQSEEWIRHCLEMAIYCKRMGWDSLARSYLGAGLHTVQDRYAHAEQGARFARSHTRHRDKP